MVVAACSFSLTCSSTGLTNTSVSSTIYTDNQLAVYQVDKVLLPVDIFTPKPPTPAPAPEKPKKRSKAAESPEAPEDNSGAVSLTVLHNVVFFGVGIVAVIFSL